MDELLGKYQGGIAHTFILHGAIEDFVDARQVKLDSYLSDFMSSRRQVVCFYDRARGITFARASMAGDFARAAGIELPGGLSGESRLPLDEGPNIALLRDDPQEALAALERAMRAPELRGQMALIVEYPELLWPNGDPAQLLDSDRLALARLRRWASGQDMVRAQQVILLVCPLAGDLHAQLRTQSAGIEMVEIPYPDVQQRDTFCQQAIDENRITLADGLDAATVAQLTGGLTRVLIDDIFLRAALEGVPVDAQLIRERKEHIIRREFGELIEILEPRSGLDSIGGLEEVKRYLRASVIAPLQGRAPRERVPSGVLLAGPPGTGKTMLVGCLAHDAQLAAVKLNAGRLLGAYVGESERNLERALRCIRSLEPVIVLIDELEQQFQRGSNTDGGVERRLFGRLLEEMSGTGVSRRGMTVWFAATNHVEMVDPALRRPGRFDRIVPILPPDLNERRHILETKLEAPLPDDPKTAALLAATDGMTGADLEGVLVKAAELAYDAGRDTPQLSDLELAAQLLVPVGAEEREQMVEEAIRYCNDRSLLPAAYRTGPTAPKAPTPPAEEPAAPAATAGEEADAASIDVPSGPRVELRLSDES
jgi:ATP-dependent 26S proteasome regulatory subunit